MQPDTIIPDQTNPQSWNRYSYGLNNPILHNDPTGHCATLCTALVGALIGGLVNYGVQTYQNMTEKNMSFSDAINFNNIDKKSLTVSIAGGFVAGLTMGVGSALAADLFYTQSVAGSIGAFVVKDVIAGGVANVAASQTEKLASQVASPRCVFCWEYNDDILGGARKEGFGNSKAMWEDFKVGAFWGGVSGMLKGEVFDSSYASPRPPTPYIRAASKLGDAAMEYLSKKMQRYEDK